MSVVYSPLCNTSESAYFLYCLASYGAGSNIFESVDGERVDTRRDGGSGGISERVGVVSSGSECPWSSWLAVTGLHGSVGRVVGAGRGVVEAGVREESDVGGVSGCGVGSSSSGDVGSHGDDVSVGDTAIPVGVSDEKLVSSAGGRVRGEFYQRNKASRDRKKRSCVKKRALLSTVGGGEVPEWRRKGEDKSDARKTLEEKWVLQNKVDAMKLEEQLKRLEFSAGDQRLPVVKVRTEVDAHLEAEARRKKLRNDIQKYEADAAYWSKRKQSGAVDKAIALEMEILDGQLSGKYDVFADRRTVGWAKTVRTNSSTGSSAKKTVWSGSGASKLSDSSESLVSLEKYEASEKERKELLKKSQEQEVEIKRVTDVAKQLQRKLRFDREEERKNSLYSAYE